MTKTPKFRVINARRRSKGFSMQEWRMLFEPRFKRTVEDVWRRLYKPTRTRDREHGNEIDDIRQVLEIAFIRFHGDFMAEDDRYEFPPSPGPFYTRTYFLCHDTFMTPAYSKPHDDVAQMRDVEWSPSLEEEIEETRQAHMEQDLCRYLEQTVGISPDDQFGAAFSFWWLGYPAQEIAVMMEVSITTVYRQLRLVFAQVEALYGLKRREMLRLRGYCADCGNPDTPRTV